MRYIAPYFEGREKLSILEPSVGDGSFIKAFNQTIFPKSIKRFSFTAVEKIKAELDKAKIEASVDRKPGVRFSFVKKDFLQYQKGIQAKFSFIAGNPPYIKKSLLYNRQIEACNKIHTEAGLKDTSVKNIWPYFLIRSGELLEDDGILAFVLPSEMLQVNFSFELRQYLTSKFERLEIFTFDDLLFECKGQDTILFIAHKKHKVKGQFYTHISDSQKLLSGNFILSANKALITTDTKWTHHSLSSDELTFIHNLRRAVNPIKHYCDSKPGIVTAANSFFIINEDTEKRYNLSDFSKPIIQKGFYVNGSVVFDDAEFNQIIDAGKASKVLCISDEDALHLPKKVKAYLKIGEDLKLPNGYKCSRRKNWFVIPNITSAPEGFFFRRVHHYPKLLKNTAKVLVTDTAYQVDMRKDYSIEQLIYSFYSSLTLAFAELSGRYYGGGVLELTPAEFKNLPIPYVPIEHDTFKQFQIEFENKSSIEDILKANDEKILNGTMKLSSEETAMVQAIYSKLITKRFRKQSTGVESNLGTI